MKEQFASQADINIARTILTETKRLLEGRYWTKFVCIMMKDVIMSTNVPNPEYARYEEVGIILRRSILERIAPYSTVECFLSNNESFPGSLADEVVDAIHKEARAYRLNMLDEMIKELA